MINKFRFHYILLLAVFLGVFIGNLASQYKQPESKTIVLNTGTKAIINNFSSANTWYDRTNRWLGDRNDEMDRLVTDLKIIQYGIDDKKTELEDQVAASFASAADGGPFGALASLVLRLRKKK